MGLIKDILYKLSNKRYFSKFRNQTIFPYYHLVRDNQVAHIENLYQYKNCEQFLFDINVLNTNFKSINPKDLFNNKKLKNNFLLTFDDGLQEVYSIIYPILKKNNLKAIFFINPNFVDNNEGLYKHYISIIISHLNSNNFEKTTLDKISQILSFTYNNVEEFKQNIINIKYSEREKINDVLSFLNINIKEYLKEHKPYITKEQIQEMIDDGFYFGGHTMTHPPLNQLNHNEQKDEIINSIDWLKNNFNIDYSLFAFPFSDKSISKKLLNELFEYDNNIRVFGNSGLKKDMDERIIQRFSLENPKKQIEKQIITENLYKYFNKLIGKYNIKRK
ncbi:MAG: peptidoglycan/xylan/chitin deacetylase (PgdA/CDA1 family) [Flavobacterium sp.]|jgi:peptidoglycan/xylan/chitin deacetylase (PgdA/CDA1 family)